MSDMFEQDADALTIGDDKLAGIAQLAKRAKLLEKEILELETTLSERQSNYRKLTEEALPEAFAELGLKSFAMEEPAVAISTRAPASNEVTLVTGFINKAGETVKVAEVKELNGSDEEAIAKAGSSGKALNVILQRGLVSLGDTPATKEDLDSLVAGDRDAILLGIRRVTFGETVSLNVTTYSSPTLTS